MRISSGERLPDAIVEVLREHGVRSGWLRASGVLAEVELRAYDTEVGALGDARRVAGPVHVLSLEGSVAQSGGEPSFSMRALLARESDVGMTTLAGEIESARAVAVEVLVTVLDDLALERALDPAGVWLVADGSGTAAPAPGRPPAERAAAAPAWTAALEASERAEPANAARPRGDGTPGAAAARPRPPATPAAAPATVAAIPPRPARPGPDLDAPSPEPGDVVEHFAFGVGEVLRSDGDRLHLRVGKEGRIREIALEMLRVSPLPPTDDGKRRFKLERRI